MIFTRKLDGLLFAGTAAFALMVGCGSPDRIQSPEEGGAAEQSIINGQPVYNDTLGVVEVDSGCGGCSGTLLMNDWVLTASHCLNCTNPGNITVTHGPTGAARASAAFFLHPNVDVALIHLPTGFAFAGGTTQPPANINNRLYIGANSSLQGQTLRIDGYGRSTCWDGFGTLRTANLTVSSTGMTWLALARNGLSQIGYRGDSGGPAWFTVSGIPYVAGVLSSGNQYCDATTLPNEIYHTGAAAFRTWVNWDIITATECAAGRGECDGNYATLCETNFRSSPSHCGRCGQSCGSGYKCSNGSCVIVPNPWGGCRSGYKCCEPGVTKCALCWPQGNPCP